MDQALANPMGLNGFAFIEFTAPKRGPLEQLFGQLGFGQVARHRSKNATLWRQGDINLIVNYEAALAASAGGPDVAALPLGKE